MQKAVTVRGYDFGASGFDSSDQRERDPALEINWPFAFGLGLAFWGGQYVGAIFGEEIEFGEFQERLRRCALHI